MKGSGIHAAATLCCWSAWAISGNGMLTNWFGSTVTELSVSTELTRSWPMLCVALTAIFWLASWLTVRMCEPGRTMMSWLLDSMIEPGARTRKSAGCFAAALARM